MSSRYQKVVHKDDEDDIKRDALQEARQERTTAIINQLEWKELVNYYDTFLTIKNLKREFKGWMEREVSDDYEL
jgi:hypothetical protein